MSADTTTPSTVPALGVPPNPGLSLPVVPGHTAPPDEPNALMKWLQKSWANLKKGHFGNPKIIGIILAVVLIGFALWFLARSSQKSDSALWVSFENTSSAEGSKAFINDPSLGKTVAAQIVKKNEVLTRRDAAWRKLKSEKLAERQGAAKSLEEIRDELVQVAGEFKNDRSMKSEIYFEAARTELSLIGVPKANVVAMGLDVKGNGRGQVSTYLDLLAKAADAIGPEVDPAKQPAIASARAKILEPVKKYSTEAGSAELYQQLGELQTGFNIADPIDSMPSGIKPPPIIPAGEGEPLPPVTFPAEPKKPDDKPGDAPKPPTGFGPTEKK